MFFCSVYFYLKPNEKAAGSASYAACRGGEGGGHTTNTPSAFAATTPKFRHWEHLLWGVLRGINIGILSLLINQQLNLGCASKWLLPPLPQEKRGFDFNTTRPEPSDLHFSIVGMVRSHPQVLLWQKPRMRTEGFYSNCFQRKIQIDNTAALFTHIFEMLVMKGLSLTPSHSPHKN